MRLLDLFCGRWGWSKAFAARGWNCVGFDLTRPPKIPEGCDFRQADVLSLFTRRKGFISSKCNAPGIPGYVWVEEFDFIVASPPCEQFSVHGMKHFFPNPPYPELGITLFNHTRALCEASGLPYVIENVAAAAKFVGKYEGHARLFFLWGNAVPPLLPDVPSKGMTRQMGFRETVTGRKRIVEGPRKYAYGTAQRAEEVAKRATIPLELANCVADYAERILERAVCHEANTGR